MNSSIMMRTIADLCIGNRERLVWQGLEEKPVTKKGSNKFILGAIIDYQVKADFAWRKAEWLAEVHFKGTNDLWGEILKYSSEEWHQFCKRNSIHRFPAAYARIMRIGKSINVKYGGDARNIWQGVKASEVRDRMLQMRFGEQITNMVLGALFDENEILGSLDVKADIHVSRVLGRLISGGELTPKEAIETARTIYPSNPWLLDNRLYITGTYLCKKSNPSCQRCIFIDICQYYKNRIEGDIHA